MIGFLGASFSLLILFAVSAAAIPLYEYYAVSLNLSSGDLAMTSVMYFIGTIISLIFFARISNYWGRKRVIYMILCLSFIGCLLFIFASSRYSIFLGRFIMGLSCGLASSTVMAFIIDNEPKNLPNIAVSITSAGPNLGLMLGALSSGLLVEFTNNQIYFVFEMLIIALLICLISIICSKETMPFKQGVMNSLRPELKIPANIRNLLLPASCTAFGSWAFGGFYQSYSASIATQVFHLNDTFIASIIFISFIAPAGIGAMLVKNLNAFKAQLYGMMAFVISLVSLYLSLFTGNLLLYVIINIFVGVFQGLMFAGSMKTILGITTIQDRAGVLSVMYIISYSGAAIPNLVLSYIADWFELTQLVLGYTILSIVCCIMLLISKYRQINIQNKEYNAF